MSNPSFQRVKLPDLNECLYCFSSVHKLTDEHIVPESINGYVIFPKASCTRCQNVINKEIENPLFGLIYKTIRRAHNYRTKKRKSKNPDPPNLDKVAVQFEYTDGRKETKLLSVVDYPPDLIGLRYGTPPSKANTNVVEKTKIEIYAVNCSGVLRAGSLPGVKSASIPSLIYACGRFERFLFKIATGALSAYSRETVIASIIPKIVLGEASPFKA